LKIAIERVDLLKSPIWLQYSHRACFNFVSAIVENKIVLDCACGEATSSEIYIKAGAAQVIAADLSCRTILRAHKRDEGKDIKFINCDATAIPLPDKSIDIYSSLETIEHIEADQKYLREAKRLVRSDGWFICSTPNRTLSNPGRKLQDKPWNPYHIREYSLAEFVHLLEGFWGEVSVYGQSPKPGRLVRIFGTAGRHLPRYTALNFLQFIKLFKLIHDNPENYKYEKCSSDDIQYENILAVCQKPTEIST
jgi:ubiquinone/menaquinone biosynthesis C-methylase UbiE